MNTVLGIDLASSTWASIGSAVLTFDPDAQHFVKLIAPALMWPAERLTATALADVIDKFVRERGVGAVALDGPQGWRDPQTPQGVPGVGRRCEYECRTPAKTGVYPQVYPGNQRLWVEFSIEVFAALLSKPGVRLASVDGYRTLPSEGYVVLECFPTSSWRTSSLTPLPGKSRRPDVGSFAQRLLATFHIPRPAISINSHDDLQAVVAALVAAAYVGAPATALRRGIPAIARQIEGREIRTEGLIWDVMPSSLEALEEPTQTFSPESDVSQAPLTSSSVRVTQSVVDQVVRAGRSQAQIALRGFPPGTRRERVNVVVQAGEEAYPLIIGDSHAAWATHQTDEASSGFDRLFAKLSDQPNTWLPVTVRESHLPAHASPGDHLASHGPPIADEWSRTVSIPIRVVKGKFEGLGRELPALEDCVGDLIVPAFAVKKADDLDWLTRNEVTKLFEPDTILLFRISGRQVPPHLVEKCRKETIRDAGPPGAFVAVMLEEPLYLRIRGTKNATLDPVRCIVPALDGLTAESLNEAYRRVSEVFEPRRRSAGGNVFRSCYYFDSTTDRWRPLAELRGNIPH